MPSPLYAQLAQGLQEQLAALAPTALEIAVDANVRQLHGPPLAQAVERAVALAAPGLPLAWEEITPTEAHKTLAQAQTLWDAWLARQRDRRTLVLALGGGLTLDLVGWAAATYKRGVPCLYAPTTLLAQVDAAWGGKTGVNHQGVKNVLGSFQEPVAVVLDPAFLPTLPPRQHRAGLAEALKHGLLADPDHWHTLTNTPPDQLDWATLAPASAAIKRRIVALDPTERGPRQQLNLGHTLGHAVESWSHTTPQPLLHGEAVALGLRAAAYLSFRHAGLPWHAVASIRQALDRLGYPRWKDLDLPQNGLDALRPWLDQDKKNQGPGYRLVLLKAIGQPTWDVPLAWADLAHALQVERGQDQATQPGAHTAPNR